MVRPINRNLQRDVAQLLAWRSAERSSNRPLDIEEHLYWDVILTERLRTEYMTMAAEVIELIQEDT